MKAVGFTPHKKQREILQAILAGTEKFYVVSVGRQFGKSLMGMNLLLYWAINMKPCQILWVSPVYSQTSKVQKELMSAIGNSGIVQNCNFSDNYIRLKTGSEIIFRSAERYDNVRGWTFDYAVIDEAGFIKQEAWQEAIRPTLAVKGKKVLFLSTPKGKNWFYDLYQLGLSNDHPNYKSFKGSSYDSPFMSHEELEDARKTLPESVFKQEYMAEFLDSGGEVFSDLERVSFNQWPEAEGKIYCGIDLAKQEDWSVATFMDHSGKIVEIWRDRHQDWQTMINQILEKIKKWQATVMIEVNSIGDVIFDQIKREWQDTHPFVTSNKSKQEIIEGLILDFNNQEVKIPHRDLFGPLWDELSYFTYDYNPKTRSIKYGHPSGLHDDTVISLAITNYCRKTRKSIGSYTWKAGR
jgi:hypothetical protein